MIKAKKIKYIFHFDLPWYTNRWGNSAKWSNRSTVSGMLCHRWTTYSPTKHFNFISMISVFLDYLHMIGLRFSVVFSVRDYSKTENKLRNGSHRNHIWSWSLKQWRPASMALLLSGRINFEWPVNRWSEDKYFAKRVREIVAWSDLYRLNTQRANSKHFSIDW